MRAIREHASGRLSPLGHIATERKTDARSLDNLWLSATNSWGSATRGLRTPELFRQQRGMVNAMILPSRDGLLVHILDAAVDRTRRR
jgi:hypothetical protein